MPSGVYERTPEHCAAISRAKKGVLIKPFTLEHCTAISKGQKGIPHTSAAQLAADKKHRVPHTSKAHLAADEAKRGGDDFVTHHYIYNESDLSKNVVQMKRSDHTSLHQLLKKLGYIVPHINIKEKNNGI